MATLNGALPETVAAYTALASALARNGVTVHVADFGGVRTQADTAKILQYRVDDFTADVRAGRIPADTALNTYRPIAPYGSSYHNYGAAFDLIVVARPSNMSESAALHLAGQLAPQFGLRWGGAFPRDRIDPPHFELAISLNDARQRYAAMTGGKQLPTSNNDANALAFDLSHLLPGLTPTGDTLDLPPVSEADLSATDDSGEASGFLNDVPGGAVADVGTMDPQTEMIALGLLVAGVVWWAIRRKFS